jgi:hypothetical protein
MADRYSEADIKATLGSTTLSSGYDLSATEFIGWRRKR